MQHGCFEVALGLAFEVIAHTPLDMGAIARDADRSLPLRKLSLRRLDPYRSAPAGAMHDFMCNAAQRDRRARLERDCLRQPAQARADPGALALGEGLRLLQ